MTTGSSVAAGLAAAEERAAVLVEALPYIQRFRGRIVVVKLGGNAMVDDALAASFAEDLIPVVSTIGADASGQAYNINADTVAGALAEALGAEKVVYLTDVAGLLADVEDPTSLISRIGAAALQVMVDDGTLTGGMIPKISACLHAVDHGVSSAHLLDGRLPHVLLLELFSDHGAGTMVTREAAS